METKRKPFCEVGFFARFAPGVVFYLEFLEKRTAQEDSGAHRNAPRREYFVPVSIVGEFVGTRGGHILIAPKDGSTMSILAENIRAFKTVDQEKITLLLASVADALSDTNPVGALNRLRQLIERNSLLLPDLRGKH